MDSRASHMHIEDMPDRLIDPDAVLSDDDLAAGGLVPVAAWMRTRSSKNALRVKRAKERAENGENGPARKQLNLVAPIDDQARDALKAIAAAMLDGVVAPGDVANLATRDHDEDWRARALAAERELEMLRARLTRRWWQFWKA